MVLTFCQRRARKKIFHDVGDSKSVARIARAFANDRNAARRDACGDRVQQAALVVVVDIVQQIEHHHMALELDRRPRVLMDEAQVLAIGLANLRATAILRASQSTPMIRDCRPRWRK